MYTHDFASAVLLNVRKGKFVNVKKMSLFYWISQVKCNGWDSNLTQHSAKLGTCPTDGAHPHVEQLFKLCFSKF